MGPIGVGKDCRAGSRSLRELLMADECMIHRTASRRQPLGIAHAVLITRT